MAPTTAEGDVKLFWELLNQKFANAAITGIDWQLVANKLGLASENTALSHWFAL